MLPAPLTRSRLLLAARPRQLRDPRWKDPHFRFGTILHGNTDSLLKQNFPEMHHYMLKFNKSSVVEGIKAVKSG